MSINAFISNSNVVCYISFMWELETGRSWIMTLLSIVLSWFTAEFGFVLYLMKLELLIVTSLFNTGKLLVLSTVFF